MSSKTKEYAALIVRDMCEHEPDDNPECVVISVKALNSILADRLDELRAVLAQEAGHVEEPLGMVEAVVERQPALWVHPYYIKRSNYGFQLTVDATLTQIAPAQIPLYAAPPELAELQATIARLTAENEELVKDAERYKRLRKITPYKFKKIQDAASTDGGDVTYFHADRFNTLLDTEPHEKPEARGDE